MLPRRFFLLAALALAACPRPPVDFGKQGEPNSPQELLKRIALAEETVVGVKGDAKLFVDAPQGKGSVSLFLGVLHPAYLHIEQLDFFNRPQGVLTTDGQQFGLFDAQKGQYFHGPATPANLAKLLPIVLPPRELTALLLGKVPRIPAEDPQMRYEPAQGQYTLTLKRGGATQTLWVSPPTYRVVKSVVTGVAAYDVEFQEVQDYGAVSLPRKAVLVAPTAKVKIELTYKDITINDSNDMTLYELTPPENVPVVEVDERGFPVK